jgi:hypothetical protein
MPAPQADPARCDVSGCGKVASYSTDGTEKDAQGLGRPALPGINVCAHHMNWPHSDDAKVFALQSEKYRARATAPRSK